LKSVHSARRARHANFPPSVKRNLANFARRSRFLKFAVNRAVTCIARDQGRWYKVCAAIQATKQVRAIAG